MARLRDSSLQWNTHVKWSRIIRHLMECTSCGKLASSLVCYKGVITTRGVATERHSSCTTDLWCWHVAISEDILIELQLSLKTVSLYWISKHLPQNTTNVQRERKRYSHFTVLFLSHSAFTAVFSLFHISIVGFFIKKSPLHTSFQNKRDNWHLKL